MATPWGPRGALELIATTLAIRDGVVPPTLNLTHPGEGCDLDYVPSRAEARVVGAALSNSFAFGGLNAVLALRRTVLNLRWTSTAACAGGSVRCPNNASHPSGAKHALQREKYWFQCRTPSVSRVPG